MATALAKKTTLAKPSGKAKPGKAAPKAAAKPKADPKWVVAGQVVEFVKYSTANDDPTFSEGDRLVIASLEKKDGNTILNCVAESDYEAFQADPEDENVIGDQLFVSDVKKAEKLPDDPYKFDITHVGRLDEILAENNGDPLAAWTSLNEDIQTSFFYQGGFITELYANKKFKEYGDYEDEVDGDKVKHGSGWGKFCQEMLNMDGRKAHASMQVYRQFSAIPDFDPDTIATGVGWVKLQIMANSVNADNVEELVEKAKEISTSDFREVIRTEYATDREAQGTARQSAPKTKKTTFNFKLFEDAGEGVALVFAEAKKETGLTDDNQLLERIVMEWARDHLGDGMFAKARQAINKVQKRLKKEGHDVTELLERSAALDAYLASNEEEEAETVEE